MELSGEELVKYLNNSRQGSIWEALDITVVTAEKDLVVATMPVGWGQQA